MKQKLILFVSFLFWGIGVAFSQIKVTGIVVDEQDEPVIGATIQIKGDKSKGTITDIDGKFKISYLPHNFRPHGILPCCSVHFDYWSAQSLPR